MLQQIKKKGRKALHKVLNNRFAQRAIVSCSTMVFCVSETMATSKGAGGFTKATTEISSYQTPVSNLMKAIAAVIVLVGAFNVYFKMQNGDQDVKNILVLQNWLERRRKDMTNKVLIIKRISEFLNFPILAQPTLKKI
jgi:hypothetical protein